LLDELLDAPGVSFYLGPRYAHLVHKLPSIALNLIRRHLRHFNLQITISWWSHFSLTWNPSSPTSTLS